jgi:hypothetical protein
MMSSAGNFIENMYVKRTPETGKAIHVYSSALKATLTWQNMTTLQVLLKWLSIFISTRGSVVLTEFAFTSIRSAVNPVVAKV